MMKARKKDSVKKNVPLQVFIIDLAFGKSRRGFLSSPGAFGVNGYGHNIQIKRRAHAKMNHPQVLIRQN